MDTTAKLKAIRENMLHYSFLLKSLSEQEDVSERVMKEFFERIHKGMENELNELTSCIESLENQG